MPRAIAVATHQPLVEPSSQGIRDCLRMLADEADLLHLPATVAAIRAAVQACQIECLGRRQ